MVGILLETAKVGGGGLYFCDVALFNRFINLDFVQYALFHKAGVIGATKLLQLATKSDFNACYYSK